MKDILFSQTTTACDFLGCTNEISERANTFTSLGEYLFFGIFIFMILYGIIIIFQAGIKYLQSEGNPDKIKKSRQEMKSVFVGIIMLVLGLLGISIVLIITGLSNTLDSNIEKPDGILI